MDGTGGRQRRRAGGAAIGTGHVCKVGGGPSEDRGRATGDLVVVADGVTRFPGPDDGYPDPSPAAIAAEIVVDTVSDSRGAPGDAMRQANEAIADYNRTHRMWDGLRRFGRDVASTVAAAAFVRDGHVDIAYVGDAGVAVLGPGGELRYMSPDDIEPVRYRFPGSSVDPHERMATMIENLRNRTDGEGYGVLTGEGSALEYVRVGRRVVTSDDHMVLAFSDGARPLLSTASFRERLTAEGTSSEAIGDLLRTGVRSLGLRDEATISAAYLGVGQPGT